MGNVPVAMKTPFRYSKVSSILYGWMLLFLWLAAPVLAEDVDVARLSRLIEHLPHSQVQVSACIMRLPDGKILYEHHADVPLIPASNQKIITAAVALDVLGADYGGFRTELYQVGDDLWLIGQGDPGLGDPKIAEKHDELPLAVFQRWAKVLKDRGIEEISGDLIIDVAQEDALVHPCWEKKRSAQVVRRTGRPVKFLR